MTEDYKYFKHSIEKHFSDIKDFRREKSINHKLLDIFFITICAVTCGANNLKEVSEYAKSKENWFTNILSLPNGIPSYGTFWWIFCLLDPSYLETCFVKWVQFMSPLIKKDGISIDGKAQRGTGSTGKTNSFVHIVSAWSSQNSITLGQLKVDGKSNEITAIPKLLEMIDIKDNIVTIDAMGCQKEIAQKIKDKDGDYILALKNNQTTLSNEVINFFLQAKEYGEEGIDYISFKNEEKGHGREEKRIVLVSSEINFLPQKKEWAGLKTIICVNSKKNIGKKKSEENRYYISSLTGSAEKFGKLIRSHWGIESAHWILDVAFREDAQKAKSGNIPENFSLLRRISLNYLKQEKTVKAGIEIKRKKAGWSNDYLLRILGVKSFL